MSDSEAEKNKSGTKSPPKTPPSTAPVARLTGGGSGEIRIIERVVRESETSSSIMVLTRTNYMEWALLMQVKLQVAGVWSALTDGAANERDDRRALQIILTGVPPEMLRVLAAKDTAKIAWETIKTLRMGSECAREAKAAAAALALLLPRRRRRIRRALAYLAVAVAIVDHCLLASIAHLLLIPLIVYAAAALLLLLPCRCRRICHALAYLAVAVAAVVLGCCILAILVPVAADTGLGRLILLIVYVAAMFTLAVGDLSFLALLLGGEFPWEFR